MQIAFARVIIRGPPTSACSERQRAHWPHPGTLCRCILGRVWSPPDSTMASRG